MKISFTNWVVCGLLLAVMAGTGCKGGNIFGLRDPGDDNVADLVAKGQKLLRDGKFDEAEAILTKAVKADSLNSDARFYRAKATLLASGISVVALIRDVTDNLNNPGSKVPLYTRDTGVPVATEEANKTKIYRATGSVADDLTLIADGLTHGTFDSTSIGLDLALANAVYGLLTLRDTDQDGEIKSPDDLYLDFSIGGSSGNEDFEFGSLHHVIANDTLSFPQIIANAESFNEVLELLAGTGPSPKPIGGFKALQAKPSLVERILANIRQAGLLSSDTSIDVNELTRLINRLGINVRHYFINTGKPGNPGIGDNDKDERVDEEIINGEDDDNDGRIDEDSSF